ncbi:hypothetical protein DM02DRAFT_430475 [Periconia macrospinosa]|uniref:Zn(2)-C6 fungal-type domain-containing protein n=1 Tax=Periconia macrospinosa TaxID=97972 RepID=A0A2V1DN38_9PLEO|nr:hypothetical protein DM02DRAFT_430475 [Periconia macrospinosa]
MDHNAALSILAQRTCVQCKASKKKCNKLLPKCSRCLRLTLECSYSEGAKPIRETDSVSSESRFDEVFQRLQRLEAHVFPSGHAKDGPLPQDVLSNGHSNKQDDKIITHENWAVNPGYVKPSHMTLVLFGTLTSVLGESNTTMQAVVQQYFKTTARWLPMIWQAKIEEQVSRFRGLESTSKFHLQCLAMFVLSSHVTAQQGQTLAEHPWYRACKYFFAHFIALGKPCVEYVQAGMLLALFEHVQCVEDRAPTTLGICIRVAHDLGWDDVVATGSSYNPGELTPQHEEIFLTWWGLQRLERCVRACTFSRLCA